MNPVFIIIYFVVLILLILAAALKYGCETVNESYIDRHGRPNNSGILHDDAAGMLYAAIFMWPFAIPLAAASALIFGVAFGFIWLLKPINKLGEKYCGNKSK